MGRLVLTDLSKQYESGTEAVRGVSLDVAEGEFLVLLGPSGCGKTSVLRMVAGLEEVTSGTIELDGRVLNDVPERDRDIAMVFQNYALYPHMSVYRNIEYPLRHRGVPKRERGDLVRGVAEMLGLGEVLASKPAQLSGGQRQRVAMGRAMVRHPKTFLMDEPLSNLDAALRVQMRTEINALQRRLSVTTMYVTHDQVEAMTLADRIAIMRAGHLQQVGSPDEVYERPANVFVGAFMGSPGTTMFECPVIARGGTIAIGFGPTFIPIDALERAAQPKIATYVGRDVIVGIRPEGLALGVDGPAERRLRALVEFQEVLGSSVIGYFLVEGSRMAGKAHPHGRVSVTVNGDEDGETAEPESCVLTPARFPASTRFSAGDHLELSVSRGAMRFFDTESEAAL